MLPMVKADEHPLRGTTTLSRAELILFTPGPVKIPPIVADFLANPPCNYHRQDAFTAMFRDTERDLKRLVGIQAADDWFATLMTITGTGANEAVMLALAGQGKGLIPQNGFFGARAVDQARQNQLDVAVLDLPADRPMDPDAIARALDADPTIKWVFFVSHETRTGLRNPFEDIGRLVKAKGRMVGADAISSAFAYPIDIEASQVDLATASSAKAIMSAPGIGIIYTRKASIAALAKPGVPRGYYTDVVAEYKKQANEHQTRFAQPVALHAALRAACMHLEKVGIDAHMARIQRQMKTLTDHLAGLGVRPLLADAYRSNIAVNFSLPAGLTYGQFSKRMEEQGYFCLYGIPGDQSHFQLSTIGDLSDDHIRGASAALTRVLGT
jgi:2-aminoethylphosphonate-pyruvate transaminase